MDSVRHAKDSAYLVSKGYIKIVKDSMGLDADDEADALDKIKKEKDAVKKNIPQKDSNNIPPKTTIEAVLPAEKRRAEVKDTVKN